MGKGKQYLIIANTIREARWVFRYSINKLGEEGLVEHGNFAKAIFELRDGSSFRFIGESEHDKSIGFRGMMLTPNNFVDLIRRKYKCVLDI